MNLYDVPVKDWDRYESLRWRNPDAVLPLPGEPLLLAGTGPGALKVRASNGKTQGTYFYSSDSFVSDGE